MAQDNQFIFAHSQHLASLTALRVNMTNFATTVTPTRSTPSGSLYRAWQNFFCHGGAHSSRQAASSSSIPGMSTTAMPGTTPASTTPCSISAPRTHSRCLPDAAGERAMGTYRLLQPLVRDEALSACILDLAQAVRGPGRQHRAGVLPSIASPPGDAAGGTF